MGAAIEPFAVADMVRGTLQQFLRDHPQAEEEQLAIEVAEHTEPDGSFGLTINGFAVELRLAQPWLEPAILPGFERTTVERTMILIDQLCAGQNVVDPHLLSAELGARYRIEASARWISRHLSRRGWRRQLLSLRMMRQHPEAPRPFPGGEA